MFEYNFTNLNKMVLNKLGEDFSGFSNLNDLSKYSCSDLLEIIENMEVKIWYEDVYKYVLWENNQLAITICFNLSDEFLHVEREVWKDLDVDLNHDHAD